MRIILKIHSLKVGLGLSALKYSLEKAVRDGEVFRVCGDMPSTSDGEQVRLECTSRNIKAFKISEKILNLTII